MGNGLFLEEISCSEYDGRFECDLDSMKILVQLELSIEIDGYCWPQVTKDIAISGEKVRNWVQFHIY